MTVITIRGQLGSGAPQIGKICAERLKLEYVDREIINRTADRLDRPRHQIIDKEFLPVTLKDRINRIIRADFAGLNTLGRASKDEDTPPLDNAHYMKGLKSVIRGLARTEAVVINGRGSQFFLKYHPGALHVLTVAPIDLRVGRVMRGFAIDEAAAREKINRYDNSRREFIKKYFKEDLEDPLHYDITINTGHLTYEHAADMVIRAFNLKRVAAEESV